MRNGSLTSTWLRRATILMVLFGMSWQSVSAACPPRFQGINLVPLPTGWYNSAVEMKFPTAEHIAYYKNAGMNAIRLPIQWEEMQPTLFGALNPRYVEHARDFLDLVQAQGMKVLVDLHNYGRYREQLIGAPQVPAAAFKDVWTKLASAFGSHPAIYAWGLMNEPHHTNGLWHKVAQAGVDGIRAVESGRLVLHLLPSLLGLTALLRADGRAIGDDFGPVASLAGRIGKLDLPVGPFAFEDLGVGLRGGDGEHHRQQILEHC